MYSDCCTADGGPRLIVSKSNELAIQSFATAGCSGMLPGYVAGRYSYDDCHIDLAVLAAAVGARLIVAKATGIDINVISIPSGHRIESTVGLISAPTVGLQVSVLNRCL